MRLDLRSLAFKSEWPAEPKLAEKKPAFALRATSRQPSLASRANAVLITGLCIGLPSRSSRKRSPPSPFGLRRGSLLSLRERRLVGATGIEPVTPTMSTKGSMITLNFHYLPFLFNSLILHEFRKT